MRWWLWLVPAVALVILTATMHGPGGRNADAAARADSTRPEATADTTAPATSSAWLSLLPDGEAKRRFVLDCAGCHQFDARMAMPGGAPRTREEWVARTAQMLSFAGATTGFPVIAPSRDPEETADWLLAHLDAAAPEPPRSPAPEDPRALGYEVVEYDFPVPTDLPHDVAVDPEGRLVVTGMLSHAMHVLDPATAAWSEVPIPVPDANPRAIEIDADGVWWVVLGAPQKLARHDPASGDWRTFDLGVYPHEVALDSAGRVWFNGHFTKVPEILGFVDPATGERRTYEVPTPPMSDGGTTIPYGLRVGPDGTIWMTQLVGGRLVELDPGTGEFALYDLPTPYSGPRRHDVAADGSVWVPEFANERLARFDPASGTFAEYPLPTPDALPYVARVSPVDGAVWVATAASDRVARFDPATEDFTEIPLPSSGALVRHIAIDPRSGDIWGAYGAFPPTVVKVFRIRQR